MKKLMLGILAVVFGVNLMINLPKIDTFASNNIIEYLDDIIEVNEDTTYTKVDFVVSATDNLIKCFDVVSGTLTLNGCNITASSSGVMETIFNVSNGAKLILNNVTFENVNYNKCIANSGVIAITDTTFISGRTSIENNSDETNSINYYSGNLESVVLNSGYISVYQNTIIEEEVTISVGTFADMALIVKGVGDNVFASKYIDKFTYKDNNGITTDNGYFFDYIGDYDSSITTITDSTQNISLQSGDIVLTTMNMSFTDRTTEETITYAPKYCTSYSYLKAEFERIAEGTDDTPITLYSSNGLGRTLDNFSANTNESAKFSALSTAGNLITLNVNCIVREGDSDTTLSTSKVTFLSGSNNAIFIDIPSGYELDCESEESVEFLIGEVETDIVSINGFYANSYYMRPIIEFNGSNYASYTITANFIFSEKVNYANVTLTNNYGVDFKCDENMVVGNSYDFVLTCAEDEVISSVTFNGELVQVTESDSGYTFTAVVLEENVIATEIRHILTITPNPSKTTFEYSDTIELKEVYLVSKTEESIVIEYVPSGTDIGSYVISEIKSCSSENYIINIVGETQYTITQKNIDLTEIDTKVYQVEFSSDMKIAYDKFLVDELPEYFTVPTLQDDIEYTSGEQTLRLYFTIKDNRYVIVNENNFIEVVLDIIPLEVNISNFTLNDESKEYTGSKIEISASNYDANSFDVVCLYYLSTDLESAVDAIDVGTYIVSLSVSVKSGVYTLVGSKTATLTITPKNISLDNYLASIEVTEFEYDGGEKYIDLKQSTLPDYVEITGVDSNENFKDAEIYYYNVYFGTTSDNYTCTSSQRVALIIRPKIVTISLATSEFDYTGNIPNLVVNIYGIISGDIVSVIFETSPVANIGTHTIQVLRLSNTNYALAGAVELEYIINSINVDMSGIEFNNVNTIYDGKSHKPVLTGTLPLGITYQIDNTYACINAGVYNIKCTFISSNEGIVAPSPIYAVVTIAKRELLVVYSEPSNMVANGEKKNISVEILGGVNEETIPYELTYSSDPILAGEYTCRVKLLDETNYVLKSDVPYSFIIFMSSISYNEDGVSLNVAGKFASKENLTVSKVNTKVEIVNLLSTLDIKSYLALNLTCVNYSDELVTISVDSTDIAEELKYCRVYRIKDNRLEEIEYTTSGNIISFKSNCNEEIVFVEEHTYVYMHKEDIYIVTSLASLCLVIMIVIAVINVKSKRKLIRIK